MNEKQKPTAKERVGAFLIHRTQTRAGPRERSTTTKKTLNQRKTLVSNKIKPKIKDEFLTSSSLSPGRGVELFRDFSSASNGLFRPSRGKVLSTASVPLP